MLYKKIFSALFIAAGALVVLASLPVVAAASSSETSAIEITRNGSQASVYGDSKLFSGKVRIDSPFRGKNPSHVLGATVTFEPCARTAWHSHSYGQTLIVTQGLG